MSTDVKTGDTGHQHDREAHSAKLGAALVSVMVNIMLIVLKTVVGLLTGSIGILAEAAHSLLDLAASVLAFFGIRWAGRPANERYTYGHARFENLSSWLQMLLLGGTCAFILYEAIRRIVVGFEIDVTWYAIAVIGAAILLDFFLSRFLHGTAHEHGGSAALEADALHFISDMWSAIAVLVGLTLASVGFKLADPIAAILVALLIGGTAIRSGVRTASILLDKSPGEEFTDRVEYIVASHPDIVGYHDLRARQAGSKVLLDVCIELDEKTSLGRAHEISHELSEEIKRQMPQVSDALVHAEPACELAPHYEGHDEMEHPGH